ncbi:heavy metal-associated isoprenylated plant protein 32 [Herrania umbratica]|uniref:Heavy metal-associated isoprenylated plant protein 32 n=1 Tax=Herrania umbratica TaxID=108875 RepID=A0A6J1ALE6_9ROSI|nr:heavy metal-associated isoprenylated plant protein 32 [Herrania umbratica]
MDSGSSSYTTFILRVDTQTPGWEKSMIKVLKGIPGATFSIDANGLARVSGNIDPGKTLKLLAKAGKHAQMYWIDSGTNQPAAERRDHHHHFDDPQGRYWQANHQYYHPYPFPPPQYLPPPPSMLPEHFYAGESQCMIM